MGKRYSLGIKISAGDSIVKMCADKEGDYVEYDDYARLRAENADQADIIESLFKEVERLDREVADFRTRLKPIEEVWNRYRVRDYFALYVALKECMEGK
jgi:hypothetical protein